MSDPVADPPLRQLTRLRTEMSLASAERVVGFFPDLPPLGVEFGIAARISLPDWSQGTGLARPAAPTHWISVRKIALSLGSSPETTRRHVKLLLDRGALVSSPQGVALAVTPENEALAMGYYWGVHDLMIQLIEDMAATCDIEIPVGHPATVTAADVVAASIDILLRPIDTFRPSGKLWNGLLLWAALTAVAVRGVTYDPVLSRRYANAIPPDELRAASSVRRLAGALSISYATGWRYMQTLLANGLVTRLGEDRWTVLTENLLHASVRDLSAPVSAYVLRQVRELGQLGLDPARAAEHYHLGRLPLADLGLSPERIVSGRLSNMGHRPIASRFQHFTRAPQPNPGGSTCLQNRRTFR